MGIPTTIKEKSIQTKDMIAEAFAAKLLYSSQDCVQQGLTIQYLHGFIIL